MSLARPELERDVNENFRASGIDLGGRRLAQCLEQLRIVVAFHERRPRVGRPVAGAPRGAVAAATGWPNWSDWSILPARG